MQMIQKFQGTMFVGQAVYMSLYGKGIGYIYELDSNCNKGDSQHFAGGVGGSGGGEVKVVFARGTVSQLPECLLRGGIQYGITEAEPATAEELAEYLAHAEQCQAERDAKEAARKAAFAESVSKQEALYPHLVPLRDKKERMSEVAFVATNIRRILKREFTGVKFSVKSDRNSVDIHWTDGVSAEKVAAVTNIFKDGSFNGYEDYFEHNDSPFTTVFGGAHYISQYRSYSDELVAKVCELFSKEWSYKPTLDEYRRGAIDFKYQREFNEMLRTYSVEPEVKETPKKPKSGKAKRGMGADAEIKSSMDNMTLTKESHTKTGKDLFIVRLDTRLEREKFVAMKALAKKFKGYYSSFKQGFIFPEMPLAEQFMA